MCCFSKLRNGLTDNYSSWSQINAPPYVLEWIKKGVSLPFEVNPVSFCDANPALSSQENDFVSSELDRLVKNGSLVQCTQGDIPECVSSIFCVPKKNKKYQLVTDLRHLNTFCNKRSFQYEDIRTVLDIVQPFDNLITVDIKDGFFHVPVNCDFQKYLGNQHDGVFYKWICLPFGLSLSPYLFC